MIRISVWCQDLSETYLTQVTQLGAECIDFGSADLFNDDTGILTMDNVRQIQKHLRQWGLSINRVTLPSIDRAFMTGESDDESSIKLACQWLEVFAEAGVPIARQRLGGDIMPGHTQQFRAVNRGGYTSRGEYAYQSGYIPPDASRLELWWKRFQRVFEQLIAVAEAGNIKLAVHPSDTPFPGTPFDSLGLHRVIDAFPSKAMGLLYCVGTRAEAGGSSLVLDEINHYGRKARLFAVHLRNVRGSLATAGGFTEVLLDDGDLNMARILRELHHVGFDGCVNPDHIPLLHADANPVSLGLAYSIGYIKALLAALYA